jgi:hypothetical protein
MPYIISPRKKELDHGAEPANAGDLTYVLQQTIEQYLRVHGLRYQHIAEVLGSIEGAKLDFIERVVKPYEAKKCRENGDVWPESLQSQSPSTR